VEKEELIFGQKSLLKKEEEEEEGNHFKKKKQPIYQSRRRQTPHQIQITSTRCQLVMLNDKDSSFIISGFSNSIYSSNSTPLFLSFFSFLFSSSASKVQKERRDCWKRFLDRRLGLA
jgi:hypothetical protein